MNWRESLAAAGCRVTAPRKAVMQVLARASGPLSPQQILSQGRQNYAHMGLVTVYRTLALFETMHLVRRVYVDDQRRLYVLASSQHRDALICQHCGHAVEFPDGEDIEKLIRRVEAHTGYSVEAHWLQLYGSCPECRRQRKDHATTYG